MDKKVLVLEGGLNEEHQVSLKTSKEVKKILDSVIRFYNSNSKLVDYIYIEEKNLLEKSSKKDDESNIIKFK